MSPEDALGKASMNEQAATLRQVQNDFQSMTETSARSRRQDERSNGRGNERAFTPFGVNDILLGTYNGHTAKGELDGIRKLISSLDATLRERDYHLNARSKEHVTRQGKTIIRSQRTVFTAFQMRALENCFAEGRYLSTTDRRVLAHALHLTSCQIRTWFQNKRMKLKKTQGKGIAVGGEWPTRRKGRPKKNDFPNRIASPSAFLLSIDKAAPRAAAAAAASYQC